MQHLTIRTIKKTFSRYATIPCNQGFKNKFNFQKYYYGKIEKSEVFCNIFIKKIWQVSVAGNKRLFLAANTCQIFFFWSKYSKNLHFFQNLQELFQNFNIYFANFLLKMQHLTIRTIKKTFS